MRGMQCHSNVGERAWRMRFRAVTVAWCLFPLLAPGPAAALDLDSHRGRVVVLDFWASWCVPCRRSFPWLNSMHDKYGPEGLIIIGVNLDESRPDAEAFLAEFPPRFEVVYDETRALAREFGVEAMPMSFVIDREGQLMARHYGFKVKKQSEYEAVIAEALARE